MAMKIDQSDLDPRGAPATRRTARGTFEGEFQGIPPNGKHGAITGITIDRIANGQGVECWTNADDFVPCPEHIILGLLSA